jgi:hypothetical protein
MLRVEMESRNVPCWFGISFKDNPLSIAVEVHKDIINLLEDKRMILFLQEKFGFQGFSKMADEEQFFGFDHAGIKNDVGEFVEIFFVIPPVDIVTNDPCPHCKGTGEDDYFKRPCSYCEGTKKKISHDYKSISAVSASLSVLFRCTQIYSPDKETASKVDQLIALDVVCLNEMGGSGIGGVWSAEFCDYLCWLFNNQGRAKNVMKEASEAMKAVYHHCYYRKDKDLYEDEFWARVEANAWLIINFSGDRCGIHPSERALFRRGCEFSCHNVDTAVQQLGLLAALCVIHSKAREDAGHY